MHQRLRRSLIAMSSASLVLAFAGMGGAASGLALKGIKGDPQPELKPFTIGAADGGGTVGIEPNGSLVVAYSVAHKTTGAVEVCQLARGGHSCTHRVELNPLSGEEAFGPPRIFVSSANHVEVLLNTCCSGNADGDDLVYTSTDGGSVFDAPVRIGSSANTVAVTDAVRIGSNIVFTGGDPHSGAQVASIPDDPPPPQPGFAQVTDQPPVDAGISDYKGGVLVGNDVLGKDYTTSVEYAPAGMDFNSAASYAKVATFSHEQLLAMSGSALLTRQTTGKQHMLLRLFGGKAYGAPHAVPGYKGTLGQWATLDRDPSGVTHVFVESSFVSPIYDLLETSTTTGAHWSGRTDLGNAIDSNIFNVDLDSIGSGLVIGGGGNKAIGYPVLAHQSVSFKLSKSSVKKGHKVTGSGAAHAAAKGRKIELQVEKGGRWFDVASTHEKGGGSFSFKIKDTILGKRRYRAVASDHAGYVEFGYSVARSLTVKK